jgi:hypothetical protein
VFFNHSSLIGGEGVFGTAPQPQKLPKDRTVDPLTANGLVYLFQVGDGFAGINIPQREIFLHRHRDPGQGIWWNRFHRQRPIKPDIDQSLHDSGPISMAAAGGLAVAVGNMQVDQQLPGLVDGSHRIGLIDIGMVQIQVNF